MVAQMWGARDVRSGQAAPIRSRLCLAPSAIGETTARNFFWMDEAQLHVCKGDQLAPLPAMLPFRRIPKLSRRLCRNYSEIIYPIVFRGKQAKGPLPLTEEQANAWNTRATLIQLGEQKSVLAVLEERGLIKDIAG